MSLPNEFERRDSGLSNEVWKRRMRTHARTRTQTHTVHIYFGTLSLAPYLSNAAASLAPRPLRRKVHFPFSNSMAGSSVMTLDLRGRLLSPTANVFSLRMRNYRIDAAPLTMALW